VLVESISEREGRLKARDLQAKKNRLTAVRRLSGALARPNCGPAERLSQAV